MTLKRLLAGSFFLGVCGHLGAQGLQIGSGAQVVVSGSAYIMISDGHFTNNGTFTAGASGTVGFAGNGGSVSFINGTNPIAFQNLSVNRSSENVQLGREVDVNGTVTMVDGDLLLDEYNLNLGTTGTVSGEDGNTSIIAASTGVLIASADLNNPSGSAPGNIGIAITSAANLGNTTVSRFNGTRVVSGVDQSISRYYQIVPTNNTDLDATVVISYFEEELGTLDENDLNGWVSNDNTTWTFKSRASLDESSNTLTSTSLDELNYITLASNNDNLVLALNLLDFRGNKDGNNVLLNWLTGQELNNDRFDVERSSNGIQYSMIGSVASRGDHAGEQSYSFTDRTPLAGTNYYRLKIFDKDLSFEYSPVIPVRMDGAVNALSVYPVPVAGAATVRVLSADQKACQLVVTDLMGKTVHARSISLEKGTNFFRLPMENLAAGTYYLHLPGTGLKAVKVIKK